MARYSAVVLGATGMVGRSLTEALALNSDWDVVAAARQPVNIRGVNFVSVDIASQTEARQTLREFGNTTHIFYAARSGYPEGESESTDRNLLMLRNVVEAIEPCAARLRHIHLVEGTKWYGSHLGAFRTPAREDDPRAVPPNFYHLQQDYLSNRQRHASWTWSASRPHAICHAVADTPRNIVLVIAGYAAICREMGLPLNFPGTPANYRALYQCTSVDQLIAAMLWMVDEPRCANQAFNIINGDYFRWENMWPRFAEYFGMPIGPVRTIHLGKAMADKGAVWDKIVRKHGLRPTSYDNLALWSYGDYVFTPSWDIMSDMTKARLFGFNRTVGTEAEFIRYFDLLRANRILP
jgi:nucleoside-diphosphate-sugar epimerase